jgi:hypothetical protein
LSSHARRRRPRERVATAAGLIVGGIPFFLALLNYRADVLRTAVSQRYASNFFDLQAAAFLHGHVDVPKGSLGIEGFVIGDKTFMYFPPFPALLRVPVQLVTHEFDGRLSLISMGIAWAVLAICAQKLLWLLRVQFRGEAALSRFEWLAAVVVLGFATGGTTLTFDAALPWVYHEVYLWSTALLVGCCYWMLRVVLSPDRRSVLWLGGFILAEGLTRTPGGWAVACTTIVLGATMALRARRRLGLAVLAAGAVPLAVAVLYNVFKFGHPYLFPLQSQVWTQVNAHRREALRVNGGTITGSQFFETSVVNYLRPDGLRFVDYFPFITLPAEPARAYGGAFLDQTYRTGSVMAFMPGLVVLTLVALVALLLPRSRPGVAAIRWPMFAAVGATGGVMGYGYLANRYTSDFVPMLVLGGFVGMWTIVGLVPRGRVWRGTLLAVLGVLCAFSIVAQLATGSAVAAQTWGGDRLANYLMLQQRLRVGDGSSSPGLTQSDALPAGGRADQLHITGPCAAVYLNTGDQYEPWTLVEQREMVVTVRPVFEDYRPGIIRLFRQTGLEERGVGVEFDSELPEARLVIEDPDGNLYSPWFEVRRARPFTVTAHTTPETGQTRIRIDDAVEYDLYLATSQWNENWYNVQTRLSFTPANEHGSSRHALVSSEYGPVRELCARLGTASGRDVATSS